MEARSDLIHMIRTVTADGLSVLYVTHRLEEVFQVADRVTILRDGVRLGTWPATELTRETMADLITGGQLAGARQPAGTKRGLGPTVLSVQEISSHGIDRFSLDLRTGEIVGIAGVVGSGRESVLSAIFGSAPRYGGGVALHSTVLPAGRPDRSVRAGLAYLPADRKTQGVVHGLSAPENLTLSDLRKFWNGAAATLSGIAGVMYGSESGPALSFGPTLLLPAFAAAFLGSTQLKRGRFNVWGSLIAVYVLATGVKGLSLVTGVLWLNDMFNGVALIAAVAFAIWRQHRALSFRVRSRPAQPGGQGTGSKQRSARSGV